ncbi:hypothetical protein LTR36_000581 [Oleoguttula mirabilis]|uniref:Uncharacterized protein n=1 Tax=Oleoguttula mirabilis TaxID=1507867 RepID=A0AAV9JRL4_9PEZI|nr:hypothetical protein LTR36_000581 [Oleoguttula mirabilis]
MTSQMREALKGQGGGLQNISTSVGEMIAGQSDTRGSKQKKADDASTSLGDMANPSKGGQTTEGTSISGGDQATNMSSGSADHLDLGFRKS